MGKNSVSRKSVPIHKTKLMKLNKKKKHILDRVLDYLKSDTYLFAPLTPNQRLTTPTASVGVGATESIKEKNKQLVEKLMDYLNSDYHMYAPLVAHKPCLNADKALNYPYEKADMDRVKEVMKNVTDETRVPKHQTRIESVHLDGPRGKTTRVKHTLLQEETVKHLVQQNHRSSSRKKLLQVDAKKLVDE